MKTIKKTSFGHDLLTSSFTTGVELGRTGKKLNNSFVDFMTYSIGPETLVEYYLGYNFGAKLKEMNSEEQEAAIEGFKERIILNIGLLNEQELKDLESTPVINTLYNYAMNKESKKVVEFLTGLSVELDKKRSVKEFGINAGLLLTTAILDAHLLVQPVICKIRKVIGTSDFGKKILENNYDKGLEGKLYSKASRLIVDVLVAPSVLDTMRIGNAFHKNNKSLEGKFFKEIGLSLLNK
jgi:hypothetical protein